MRSDVGNCSKLQVQHSTRQCSLSHKLTNPWAHIWLLEPTDIAAREPPFVPIALAGIERWFNRQQNRFQRSLVVLLMCVAALCRPAKPSCVQVREEVTQRRTLLAKESKAPRQQIHTIDSIDHHSRMPSLQSFLGPQEMRTRVKEREESCMAILQLGGTMGQRYMRSCLQVESRSAVPCACSC